MSAVLILLISGGFGALLLGAMLIANRIVYGGWLRFPFTGGR